MDVKLSFIRSMGAAALLLPAAAAPAAGQQEAASGGGPGPEASPDSLPTYADADGRVYLTRDEALLEVYPDAGRVQAEWWSLTEAQARRIESRSRVEVPDRRVIVYRVLDGGGEDAGLLGYAMILEERGKYRPITMLVGIEPDGSVRGVEVMVYREDRGEEVRYERFLRQYRGMGTGDPIRTHRDIMNITGATISVHSMNDGVRRALCTVKLLYGDRGRERAGDASRGGEGNGPAAPAAGEPAVVARWEPGAPR